MSSRSLDDLAPEAREKAIAALEAWGEDAWMRQNGITILVTCTHRSFDEQAELYAQGRTKDELSAVRLFIPARPGKIVTWALPGQSKHNTRNKDGKPASEAFDVVPLRYGKPVWGTAGDGIDDNPADDATDDLEVWDRVGAIGKSVGLKWAGDWPAKKRERPHFEI